MRSQPSPTLPCHPRHMPSSPTRPSNSMLQPSYPLPLLTFPAATPCTTTQYRQLPRDKATCQFRRRPHHTRLLTNSHDLLCLYMSYHRSINRVGYVKDTPCSTLRPSGVPWPRGVGLLVSPLFQYSFATSRPGQHAACAAIL
jgi:hypothetical protein